ncbi:hypothetical protein QZH41_015960, partial [Actinostola sp. cb2023]
MVSEDTQESTPSIGQASTSLSFTSNFPVPSPMVCQDDKVANWEFFQQQWEDYEVATGLDRRDPRIRLATLRSVMGKEPTNLHELEAYRRRAKRHDQETTDEFVNRIRKLTSSCEFGTLTEELIRD